MTLKHYLLKRTIFTALAIFGLITGAFFLTRVIPANPALMFLGEHASREQVEKLTHEWKLDRPLWEQYVLYLQGLLRWDMGNSLRTGKPALYDMLEYFPATLELSIASVIWSSLIGILLGVASAVKRNRPLDHLTRVFSLFGASMPVYWTGLLAVKVLYGDLRLVDLGRLGANLAPPTHITGLYVVDSLLTGNLTTLLSSIKQLILPSLILGGWQLAGIVRLTRANMLDVLNQDYVMVAKAKGLPRSKVIYKHALRNALLPTITLIGLSFGATLGGAVITEIIFIWPGIGSYLVYSINFADFIALTAGVVIIGILYAFVNLAIDMLYCFLDPRLRYG